MIVESDLAPLLTGAPCVTRVGPDLNPGEMLDVSGKFLLHTPPQAGDLRWLPPVRVLPQDGRDVVSATFGRLAQRLGAARVLVNPFLQASDTDQLDFDANIPDDLAKVPRGIPARFCAGRGGAGPQGGGAPGMVSVLPPSPTADPPLPGLLVTKPLDLSPYLTGCEKKGVHWVRVYWKLGFVQRSADHASDLGAFAGQVATGRRYHVEPGGVDGFSALVASGSGGSFCRTGLLDVVHLCAPSKTVRLAFRNDSLHRVYLLCYAVLF